MQGVPVTNLPEGVLVKGVPLPIYVVPYVVVEDGASGAQKFLILAPYQAYSPFSVPPYWRDMACSANVVVVTPPTPEAGGVLTLEA